MSRLCNYFTRISLSGDRSEVPPGVGLVLTGFTTVATIISHQTRPQFTDWVKMITDNTSFELMIANEQRMFYQVWEGFLLTWEEIVANNMCTEENIHNDNMLNFFFYNNEWAFFPLLKLYYNFMTLQKCWCDTWYDQPSETNSVVCGTDLALCSSNKLFNWNL